MKIIIGVSFRQAGKVYFLTRAMSRLSAGNT